jgi:hypothetical protein
MFYLHKQFDYMRGAPQTAELAQRLDWVIGSIDNIPSIIHKGNDCLRTFYQPKNELKFDCLAEFTDLVLEESHSDFLKDYITIYHKMPWYGHPSDIFVWHLLTMNIHAHKEILDNAEKSLLQIVNRLENYLSISKI